MNSDPRNSNDDYDNVAFRLIESSQHISQQGGSGYKYMMNRVPKEMIELSQGRTMEEFVEEFQELIVENSR